MKISIITVCYNRETTIRQCIESVLAQDYTDIEYIVVDGASTDHSLNIIQEYKDKINRIVSEPDNGMYEAINKGIRMATGDVVGLIHADDCLYENHIVSDIAACFEKKDIDMVYGNGIFVDGKNTDRIVRKWISGKYRKSAVKWGWLPLHPTVYMKRCCFDKVGWYNESYQIAADTDFLVRCLYHEDFKVEYLNQYIVRMRMGGLSTDKKLCKLKWSEDIRQYKANGIAPIPALIGKISSKIPQYIRAKIS